MKEGNSLVLLCENSDVILMRDENDEDPISIQANIWNPTKIKWNIDGTVI